MATNLTDLTKGWIQYLKNNQIVSTQSNPKTGRLNYKRKPNVTELMRYIQLKTDFDETDIRNAIKTVLGAKQGSAGKPETPALSGPPAAGNVATTQKPEMTPGQAPQQPQHREPVEGPAAAKKYSNDDAEDIQFREPGQEPPALTNKKKPRVKYSDLKKGLKEDFYDRQGAELDENDIKQIFKILLTPKEEPAPEAEPEESDEEKLIKKQDQMRKLKELVRDAMTPEQRKALWRILNQTNLSEAIITNADTEAILKGAAEVRNAKPKGMSRLFPGLRKDAVNFDDLRQAWANGTEPDGSDGYSNDTTDIKRILLKFGYDEKEINKIFAQVFKTTGDEYDDKFDSPTGTRAVQKVADLAEKYGLTKSLRNFLETEFADEIGITKATNEDIRQIFEQILQTERTGRPALIKQQEQIQLGRSKK